MSSRILAIGDIHSGLKALKQLLQKAEITTKDKLIFLGDYVDGWSQAVETVDFLLNLKTTHNCVFLRGNHDELCYEWLRDGEDNPLWLQHGGRATMASYEQASKKTIEAHMYFYENLENYYLDSENRLFLHAGFTNLKGIDHEYFKKTFYWDRTLWELARSLNPALSKTDAYYPQRLRNYEEIYIGHTPISKTGLAVPERAANVWNIDTGAAFKGPLSMIDVITKELYQSNPVYTFYPQENGRN